MPRKSRIVAIRTPHHITQRGVRQLPIFESDDDRRIYLSILAEQSIENKLEVLAYCLMTNHVHIVGIPLKVDSLSRTLQCAHIAYAQYFNRKKNLKGHLFENRFYSAPMDDDHAWKAIRYVELNPVRAGIVAKAEDYPWSSAKKHCQLVSQDPVLSEHQKLEERLGQKWEKWLQGQTEDEADRIRLFSRRGLPIGSSQFVEALENETGMQLQSRSVGRPKKK